LRNNRTVALLVVHPAKVRRRNWNLMIKPHISWVCFLGRW